MEQIKSEISDKIKQSFEPLLREIERKMNCEHDWEDKNGGSVYLCKKCKYIVYSSAQKDIDNLIFIQKAMEKGNDRKVVEKLMKHYK